MANESDIYLEELSVAIKSLQIKSLLQSDEKTHVITFSKQDDFKALNYFCLTLDKIFMHGLRNKDNGYWMFVKSFCTRDMIHQIIQLKAVQTNIGRGRTWLFMILNERILDGYLTTFQHNPMIIQEYYHSFGLLCSPQLMLLQSLICGLEHVHFKIETDTHYWDAPDFPTYIPSFPNFSESNRRNILHHQQTHSVQNPNVGSSVVINHDAIVNIASKGTVLASKAFKGVFGTNSRSFESDNNVTEVAQFETATEQPGIELTCMALTVQREETETKTEHLPCSSQQDSMLYKAHNRKESFHNLPVLNIPVIDAPIEVQRFTSRRKHSSKPTATKGTQCDDYLNDVDSGLLSDLPSSANSSIDLLTAWLSASHTNESQNLFGVHEISTQCDDLTSGMETLSQDQNRTELCLLDFVSEDQASHDFKLFSEELVCNRSQESQIVPKNRKENPLDKNIEQEPIQDQSNSETTTMRSICIAGCEHFNLKSEPLVHECNKSAESLTSSDIVLNEPTLSIAHSIEQNDKNEILHCPNETIARNVVNTPANDVTVVVETNATTKQECTVQTNKLNIDFVSNGSLSCSPDYNAVRVNTDRLCVNNNSDPVNCVTSSSLYKDDLTPAETSYDDHNFGVRMLEVDSKATNLSNSSTISEEQYPDIYELHSNGNMEEENFEADHYIRDIRESCSSSKSEEFEIVASNQQLYPSTSSKMNKGLETVEISPQKTVPILSEMHDIKLKHEQPSCLSQGIGSKQDDSTPDEDNAKDMDDYLIEIDTNLQLKLMLDIVMCDDEQIFKMIQTKSHFTSEEDLFVLFTNRYIYFLQRYENLFVRNNYMQYFEVGILHSDQGVVFIGNEASNKKFMRCDTSNPALTKLLVSYFYEQLATANEFQMNLNEPSNWSSHTKMLESCVSAETGVPVSHCDVLLYMLVSWRPQVEVTKCPTVSGELAIKTGRTLFGGDRWITSYFFLEDGLLYQYKKKDSGKPDNCYVINEDVVTVVQDHASDFSIVLKSGEKVELRAKDNRNANTWSDSILKCIKKSEQFTNPASLIITTKQILLCHEDPINGFCRCLTSVHIDDVTSGEIAHEERTCVLYLRQPSPLFTSSDYKTSSWILKFATPEHCEQFKNTIYECSYAVTFFRTNFLKYTE